MYTKETLDLYIQTDGRVYYLYYAPEMEETTKSLRLANQFVCAASKTILRRLKIDELGNSEAILLNQRYLRETSPSLIRRGIIP